MSYCDIYPLVIIITIYSLALSEEAFVAGALGTEWSSSAALNSPNKSVAVL